MVRFAEMQAPAYSAIAGHAQRPYVLALVGGQIARLVSTAPLTSSTSHPVHRLHPPFLLRHHGPSGPSLLFHSGPAALSDIPFAAAVPGFNGPVRHICHNALRRPPRLSLHSSARAFRDEFFFSFSCFVFVVLAMRRLARRRQKGVERVLRHTPVWGRGVLSCASPPPQRLLAPGGASVSALSAAMPPLRGDYTATVAAPVSALS